MNSSAKFTFMFLGAVALGGVAFACTVSSGTVDDTDGGVNQNTSSSSSTSSSTSSSSSSSGSIETVCPEFDAGFQIDSADCNTCLLTNCCTETSGCFDIPDTDASAGDPSGCFQYKEGLYGCDTNPGTQGVEQCKQLTKQAANTAVPAAYDTYLACRTNKCATQCAKSPTGEGIPAPDGGSTAH